MTKFSCWTFDVDHQICMFSPFPVHTEFMGPLFSQRNPKFCFRWSCSLVTWSFLQCGVVVRGLLCCRTSVSLYIMQIVLPPFWGGMHSCCIIYCFCRSKELELDFINFWDAGTQPRGSWGFVIKSLQQWRTHLKNILREQAPDYTKEKKKKPPGLWDSSI